jgi:hypothetical protein
MMIPGEDKIFQRDLLVFFQFEVLKKIEKNMKIFNKKQTKADNSNFFSIKDTNNLYTNDQL